ncbi:MAG: ATP-binding protein, partial [Candidatus Paceibacterota bacterium]
MSTATVELSPTSGTRNLSRVAYPLGIGLLRFAEDYRTLPLVIFEQVQNALDVNATKIWIYVDQKKNQIIIRDNGGGTSRENFDRALTSCLVSSKIDVTDKFGRFGQGLISPLGKCKRNTFISKLRGSSDHFVEWEFVTEDIRRQVGEIYIPNRLRRDIRDVEWNTEVRLYETTTDAITRRMSTESLRSGIIERYNVVLLKHKVVVFVDFVDEDGELARGSFSGRAYTGKQLTDEFIDDPACGMSYFRLWLAQADQRGRRRGVVKVGIVNNPYTFALSKMLRQVKDEDWLLPDVAEALSSGVFEGEIVGTKLELHVGREKFIANEALRGFCTAINAWFVGVGSSYYEETVKTQTEERYVRLGIQTLERFQSVIKTEAFAGLLGVIKSFKIGSVGTRHTKPDDTKVLEGEEFTGTAVGGGAGKEKEPSKDPDPVAVPKPPTDEKPEHHPLVVDSPSGGLRVPVKRNSLGLRFNHSLMEGSDDLWQLDAEAGVLHINIRHP